MKEHSRTIGGNRKKILWLTRTAVFIALLIALQALTASFGNTIVTGSVVNMLLIVSAMTCGIYSGLCVGVISPVIAKLLGIGPLWELIPFIIAGNIVIITLWHFIGNVKARNRYIPWFIALGAGAAGKSITLYIGVVQIAIPLLLRLPDAQAAAVTAMFSIPQLVTALIGGAIAILLLPPLKKALNM